MQLININVVSLKCFFRFIKVRITLLFNVLHIRYDKILTCTSATYSCYCRKVGAILLSCVDIETDCSHMYEDIINFKIATENICDVNLKPCLAYMETLCKGNLKTLNKSLVFSAYPQTIIFNKCN